MEHDAIRGTEVLLKGPKDWERWLALIRSKAIHEEVWDYVNPDTDALNLPVFEPPSAPTPQDAAGNPTATRASLTADQKEYYKEL